MSEHANLRLRRDEEDGETAFPTMIFLVFYISTIAIIQLTAISSGFNVALSVFLEF